MSGAPVRNGITCGIFKPQKKDDIGGRTAAGGGIIRKSTTCKFGIRKDGVADGTRTRNSQNHNLGLYH